MDVSDFDKFVDDAARFAGVTAEQLLRQVLHIGGITKEPEFSKFGAASAKPTLDLLQDFDRTLRVANPGLHYVFRKEYIGYRRERQATSFVAGERSQIFCCVIPKRTGFAVTLPLPPNSFKHISIARDLSGLGHQGLGDLQISIGSSEDLKLMLEVFEDWLLRPALNISQ